MPYLNILRRLADNQQFTELRTEALACHDETGDVRVLPLLALAHAQSGDQAQAMEVYEQAAKRLAELDVDARVDLAGVDCVLQRIDTAAALLEPVQKHQPDNALALARLAWCRMQQNQMAEAMQFYQRSTELNPGRLPVWMALVRLHLKADNPTAAQQALNAALGCFEACFVEWPPLVADHFTAQLRGLQLEIWTASEQFAAAEEWLAKRRTTIAETQWVALETGYATLLAGCDRHLQAVESIRTALQYYPGNITLLLKLAELYQAQGHFMQAVQALRRAIHFEGTNPALWSRLANACLHRFDRQARGAAEKAMMLAEALKVSGQQPKAHIRLMQEQAKNALALVEGHEKNFEAAEQLFREVLAENPFYVPSLQGLAQQYMQQGRIEQALALYEQISQVDPLKAHAALITARYFPEDIETLERMAQAAHTPSLEGRVRSGLLFQLAAAWEKRKAYEKAFDFARSANNASRRLLPYDAKAHRNRCARIRYAFSKSLYEHRRECGMASSMPVFVLGMPRSGTTLVEQIIAGHSRIFGAGELGIIPQRIAGLNRWERHVGSGRYYPDCIDDLTPYITKKITRGILEEMSDLAEKDKPGALHVVDKLPHNFENIGFIKFLFPGAKIISVRRDPRDIAISNYFTDYQAKHLGMGFAYDLTDIGEQLADHNLLMHHWHQIFPGEILEIHYEDVVDDLEGSARRLIEYIGVDWEPQVLKFNELGRPVKTASVWQVRQPIYKTSKARWKHYKAHLAPLIRGTNAKIVWDPIDDMLTLPEPGFLQNGVDLYRQGDLDGAELSFKKMLHHNPEHAACSYMLGLVYCSKGHVAEAVPLFQKALEKCPWQREWRKNMARAFRETGQTDKAEALLRYTAGAEEKSPSENEAVTMAILNS